MTTQNGFTMPAEVIELEARRVELLTRKITRDLAAFGLDPHRAAVLAGLAVAAIAASRPGRP